MLYLRKNTWWMRKTVPGIGLVRESLHTADRGEAQLRAHERLSDFAEQAKRRAASVPPAAKRTRLRPRLAPLSTTTPTLTDAFQAALVDREAWRTGNVETLHATFRALTKQWGESRRLGTITRDAVKEWRRTMLAAGLAESTINTRLSMLSVLLSWADNEGHPVAPFKMPRLVQPRGRIRRVTPDELSGMLAAVRALATRQPKPWTRAIDAADMIEVLYETGARLNEGVKVRGADVDLEQGTMTMWDTKNGDPRAVPLTPRMLTILSSREAEHGLGRLFPGLTGDYVERAWAEGRKALGLEHDAQFVLHAMRHEMASSLADAGVDTFAIQRWMGHRSLRTTEKYVHLSAVRLQPIAATVAARRAPAAPVLRSAPHPNK